MQSLCEMGEPAAAATSSASLPVSVAGVPNTDLQMAFVI